MWVGLLDGSVLLCDWGRSDGPAVELALSSRAKLSVKTGAVVFLLPIVGQMDLSIGAGTGRVRTPAVSLYCSPAGP